MYGEAIWVSGLGGPQACAAVVHRSKLLRRLDELPPLTILEGPFGTGKTTLVADWVRHRAARGDDVRWVSAANQIDVDLADLRHIAALDSAVHGERVIVVVDDVQLPQDISPLLPMLADWKSAVQLHVVVCTSNHYELAAGASAARIETMTLTARDLSITPDQLVQFADSWGHSVSKEQAKGLHDDVGGWLGALRCALDAHAGGRDSAVEDYFRAHVIPELSGDPAGVAIMVLGTARVLSPLAIDRLIKVAELVDTTPPLGEPELLIDALVTRGLLQRMPEDSGEPRWHFPRLLSGVLTALLKSTQPDIALSVHETMAELLASEPSLASNELAGLAALHARAASNWRLLARLWNDYGLYMTIRQPLQTESAYRDLPAQVLVDCPELALASSVASVLSLDRGAWPPRTPVSNYMQAGLGMRAQTSGAVSSRLLDAASQIIAARHRGAALEAVQLAQQFASRHLAPVNGQAAVVNRAWFNLQWAISAAEVRDTATAVRLFNSVMRDGVAARSDILVNAAAGNLALLNAIAGNTRTANSFLEHYNGAQNDDHLLAQASASAGGTAQAILLLDQLDPSAREHLDVAGADNFENWAAVVLARTQYELLFGDAILALTELDRLSSLHAAVTQPASISQLILDRCRADLYLALGELNRADRHLRESRADEPGLAVPRARLAFICGDYTTARRIAAAFTWRTVTTRRDRIDLSLVKAACAREMGDTDAARVLALRAVQLAHDAGTLIPYTALPESALHSLLALAGHPLDDETLSRIDTHRQPYPEKGALIVLSQRETVVLGALADHETLGGVAEALVVSLNTVKKQLNAVYRKLGVHSREAALLQAHRLGLLPVQHPPGPGSIT